MKKLLLMSALFMGAFSTQAARVKFNFDVYSSGSSIYPCNAGIKHKEPVGSVCYNPNTFNSCNPDDVQQCLNNGEADCDCVCTGEQNGDHEGTVDFLNAKYTNWTDHGDTPSSFGYEQIQANNHDNDFNKVFSESDKFGKRIKKLTVNLGSERYGAEYYVDICYRATQINYLDNAQANEFSIEDDANEVSAPQAFHNDPTYKIERKVTVTDLKSNGAYTGNDWDLGGDLSFPFPFPIPFPTPGSGQVWAEKTYQELANLKVHSVVVCKDKGPGFKYPLGFTGQDLSSVDIADFTDIFRTADLKGCYVRYSFKEKIQGQDPIDTIRRWKLHGANICTDTAITSKHIFN